MLTLIAKHMCMQHQSCRIWQAIWGAVIANTMQLSGAHNTSRAKVNMDIFNPRRACAARVIAVVLCVCVCVCLLPLF